MDSAAFPEVGIYRPEDELNEYGSDELLLKQVASYTGGRYEPRTSDVFQATGRAVPATLRLWPGLLALAVILNIVELILRKWRGLLTFFQKPAAQPA